MACSTAMPIQRERESRERVERETERETAAWHTTLRCPYTRATHKHHAHTHPHTHTSNMHTQTDTHLPLEKLFNASNSLLAPV
jgi:hypothetical protein